jgi:hypothetical protein
VTLYYIGIASAQLSEARVSQRVRAGGHDVPPERLVRRFRQSLENLAQAVKFVPEVHVFDNSSSISPYQLVLSVRAEGLNLRPILFPSGSRRSRHRDSRLTVLRQMPETFRVVPDFGRHRATDRANCGEVRRTRPHVSCAYHDFMT